MLRQLGGLEHVQSFDDQNVGTVHDDLFARHDIIGEVRIDRRFDIRLPGLHVGDELKKPRLIEALGEALSVHDAPPLQLLIWQQEAIRWDEIDARMVRPARQKLTQNTGGCAFADSDASADADDERDLSFVLMEEFRGGGMEKLVRT